MFEVKNEVTVDLSDLTITGGKTDGDGGGVINLAGKLTLTNCTIIGNSGDFDDGLDDLHGATVKATGCTISGNSEVGVFTNLDVAAMFTNCMISGNLHGGAFNDDGEVTLTACTISRNSYPEGSPYGHGGVYTEPARYSHAGRAKTTLTDTIVAGNSGGNIAGVDLVSSSSYNLIGTGGSGGLINGKNGNIVGVADPGLSKLAYYGGPTETLALLPGSPAIGKGIAVPGITADQRGFPLDHPPDIGAFQREALVVESTSGALDTSAAKPALAGAVGFRNSWRRRTTT